MCSFKALSRLIYIVCFVYICVNNTSFCNNSYIIIISEKLSNHHKFSEYRAKIERITTIIIALIIILVGVEIVILSIKNIILPEEVDYSAPAIIVLIVSIIAKYLLAI